MLKFLIALLLLLAIAIAFGVIRKMRGGTFLPARDSADPTAPRSLEEIAAEKRKSREKN